MYRDEIQNNIPGRLIESTLSASRLTIRAGWAQSSLQLQLQNFDHVVARVDFALQELFVLFVLRFLCLRSLQLTP